MAPFGSYRAQTWDDQTLVSDIEGLSVDAARHIARAATLTGHTGRMMCESADYCEVYTAAGAIRRGTFAETTLVRINANG